MFLFQSISTFIRDEDKNRRAKCQASCNKVVRFMLSSEGDLRS